MANTLSLVAIEELQQIKPKPLSPTSTPTEEPKLLECRTPTAEEHRISEAMTCPPAPRKKITKRHGFISSPSWEKLKVRVAKEFFFSTEIDSLFLNRGPTPTSPPSSSSSSAFALASSGR